MPPPSSSDLPKSASENDPSLGKLFVIGQYASVAAGGLFGRRTQLRDLKISRRTRVALLGMHPDLEPLLARLREAGECQVDHAPKLAELPNAANRYHYVIAGRLTPMEESVLTSVLGLSAAAASASDNFPLRIWPAPGGWRSFRMTR